MQKKHYGKIKCDSENKILEFNNISEKMFNYKKKEIINKRIFLFFTKNNILENIEKWLSISQNKITKIYTILRKKNNIYFPAYIIIKPYKNKNNIYFLIKIYSQAKNIIKNNKKINIIKKIKNFTHIIRLHFLLGTIIPIIFGIVWAINKITFQEIDISILIITIIGATFCHIAANTFNDYYDWKSKTDQLNKNYILFITGGSRSIEMELIKENDLLILSIISIIIVIICGLYITYIKGITILIIGAIGIFGTYFYTAPPIKLSSRHGLGELFHIICLGPLITLGITYVLTNNINYIDFLIGLPLGILITAVLLINEFPDIESDKITKKFNLAVTLNKHYFTGLKMLIIIPYAIILLLIIKEKIPYNFMLTYITLFNTINIIKTMHKILYDVKNLKKICKKIFNLYLSFSLIMISIQIINII